MALDESEKGIFINSYVEWFILYNDQYDLRVKPYINESFSYLYYLTIMMWVNEGNPFLNSCIIPWRH